MMAQSPGQLWEESELFEQIYETNKDEAKKLGGKMREEALSINNFMVIVVC